jgi:hypothetical protein
MRLGNILATIGIVLGVLGIVCLPLWNLRELPYKADPAYPKGGGWILLIQTGIFSRPGIILVAVGGLMCLIAKLLPKKYWKTAEDISEKEIKKGYRKKETAEKKNT